MHRAYFGLGGCLITMLGAWLLADKTGRELVLDWRGCRYGKENSFNALFDFPVFKHYSQVKEDIKSVFPEYFKDIMHIAGKKNVNGIRMDISSPRDIKNFKDYEKYDCIIISRDDSGIINNPKVMDLIKLLKVNKSIQKYIDSNSICFKKFKKVIGVHFRHGNGEKFVVRLRSQGNPMKKIKYKDLIKGNIEFPENIQDIVIIKSDEINKYLVFNNLSKNDILLYLATDCKAVFDVFKTMYPNIKIFNDVGDYNPVLGGGAIHMEYMDSKTIDEQIEAARVALADMYLLAKTDFFIGGKSGYFVRFVSMLRSNLNTCIIDFERYYTDYNFNENYYPIENDLNLYQLFIDRNIPVDGIFIKIENNQKYIYYYYDLIAIFDMQYIDGDNDKFEIMIRELIKRRFY